MFKCDISGDKFILDEDQVMTLGSHHAMIDFPDVRYYVFPDRDTAGEMAKEYWEELSEYDPEEFNCLVGTDNLIKWAKGEWAGVGSTQVASLEDWFDLWLDTPEEHWARYDSEERTIYFDLDRTHYNANGSIKKYDEKEINEKLEEVFGFIPTVAYRS